MATNKDFTVLRPHVSSNMAQPVLIYSEKLVQDMQHSQSCNAG